MILLTNCTISPGKSQADRTVIFHTLYGLEEIQVSADEIHDGGVEVYIVSSGAVENLTLIDLPQETATGKRRCFVKSTDLRRIPDSIDAQPAENALAPVLECGSPEGVTIGLIDSLITICRVLEPRLYGDDCCDRTAGIDAALADLHSNQSVIRVLTWGMENFMPMVAGLFDERRALVQKKYTKSDLNESELARLEKLDQFVLSIPETATDRDSPPITSL